MCLSGVTFGYMNLDNIPWHLLAILAFGKEKFKIIDILILLICFIIIVITALSAHALFETKLFIRQVVNYASIIVGAMYLYYLKPNQDRLLQVLLAATAVNIIITCLQIIDPIFTIFTNARFESSGYRGYIGLFPEPSSYGFFNAFCFLCGVYIRRNAHKGTRLWRSSTILICLSLLSILLLNRSAGAVLVILTFFTASVLLKPKRIMPILFFVIILFLFRDYFSGTRIYGIFTLIFNKNVVYLILSDGSVNARLADLIGPYYGLYLHHFLPSSSFEFKAVSSALREHSNGYFWFGGTSNKIMNYLGTIAFELSLFSLILIYRYVMRFPRRLSDYDIFIAMLFLLNNSVSLSQGYILFFLFIVSFASSNGNCALNEANSKQLKK